MPARPYLLVLTGASGSGKTTMVRALAGRRRLGVRTYHFDAIGVPSPEEMVAEFGSGEAWQAAKTAEWLDRLAKNPDAAAVMVLEGQMHPQVIRDAWASHRDLPGAIALVDCSAEQRRARLTESRGQPELATAEMDAWAIHLREQADAFDLPILETTGRTLSASVDDLEALIRRLSGGGGR